MKTSDGLGGIRAGMADCAAKATRRSLTMYGRAVPCRAGCHGCCKRLIFVTLAEAVVMFASLKKQRKWPEVRARALAVLPASKHAPESYFRMGIECPVLDPGSKTCTAYSVRPSPCSTHFVLSHPSMCDPWSAKGGNFTPVDMEDLHEEFQKVIASELDPRGILSIRMPLPMALLLAEKVESDGNTTPESMAEIIRTEFA